MQHHHFCGIPTKTQILNLIMRKYLINPVRSILQNHWSELFKTEYHERQRGKMAIKELSIHEIYV